MLRKLFISLIILSTLTTEGIINTPWNIYNLCLFVNNINNFADEKEKVIEPIESSIVYKNSYSDLFVENKLFTQSKGIAQIKYDFSIKPLLRDELTQVHRNLEHTDYRCVLSYSYIYSHHEPGLGMNKDIVLSISDTSPPASNL